MASDPQETAKQAYIAYNAEKLFPPKNASQLVTFSKFHNPPFVGVTYSIAKKIVSNPPNVNNTETHQSSNIYLDPSITNKFMTANTNEIYTQKHEKIRTKSNVANGYDLYKHNIGEEPNNPTQFLQFCERNKLKLTYSECVEYIQYKKQSKTPYVVGDKVLIKPSRKGQVLVVVHGGSGKNKHFALGTWYGVRLTEKRGTSDGRYKNQEPYYFKCPANFGVFVQSKLIIKKINKESFGF
eukprot:244117_1